VVFEASPDVNVAIISPAFVYGLGPSPTHPFPLTTGVMLKAIRQLSSGFTISAGKNLQAFIHVIDLARMYLILLSHALKPQDNANPTTGREIWGPEAYYFAEQEELPFREFMENMVTVLQKHGELKSSAIKEIDFDTIAEAMGAADAEADSWVMHIAIMFGCNMRVRSSRARALGWKPQESGVGATMDEVLGKYLEAEKLG
jgi:nucleoside-diphosphate-sugar epimerase